MVGEGARQQNQDWDPEENGGVVLCEWHVRWRVRSRATSANATRSLAADRAADTNGASGPPPDPFALLEKDKTQKAVALTATAQLDELEQLSHSRWKDPFAASAHLRASFRAKKKERVASESKASAVRDRYGLGERLRLEDLRTPARREERDEEEQEWERARAERKRWEAEGDRKRRREEEQIGWDGGSRSEAKKRAIEGSSAGRRGRDDRHSSSSRPSHHPLLRQPIPAQPTAAQALATRLRINSALKNDPFLARAAESGAGPGASKGGLTGAVRVRATKGGGAGS